MNWDAIAAIGQAVSALALVFVLIQVRHARADMRRSLLDSLSNALISGASIQIDARVISANMKAHAALGGERNPFEAALMEQAGMTEQEARLVNQAQLATWNAMVQPIRCLDAFKPADLIGTETNLRRLYATSPIGRLWYDKQGKATMNPEVLRYMNKVLAEPS